MRNADLLDYEVRPTLDLDRSKRSNMTTQCRPRVRPSLQLVNLNLFNRLLPHSELLVMFLDLFRDEPYVTHGVQLQGMQRSSAEGRL